MHERPLSDYELSPAVMTLAARFIQRWDQYPQQTRLGWWVTIPKPMHVGLLFAHLRGRLTLGTYLLDPESRGRFLVLDADDQETWQRVQDMASDLWAQGITSYVEPSRRGGHLWLFLSQPTAGVEVRWGGGGLLHTYQLSPRAVELYPKQGRLVTGPGSLMRLPFGKHQLTGRQYDFRLPNGDPLGATMVEQLQMLGAAQTVPNRIFTQLVEVGREMMVNARIHPPVRPQNTFVTGEGGPPSARVKAAITVYEFVSQFVSLSASGVGSCPFHEDHHPSFSVNQAENYWHCFACGIGGSIIDFWMQWQGCNFTQAVTELSDMLL